MNSECLLSKEAYFNPMKPFMVKKKRENVLLKNLVG